MSPTGRRIQRRALLQASAAGAVLLPTLGWAVTRVVTGDDKLPFSFKNDRHKLRKLEPEERPYYTASVIPLESDNVDEQGVRYIVQDDVKYDNPVSQAQHAINLYYSYLASGDDAYLQLAVANGKRMIETATVHRSALYMEYPFEFHIHGKLAETLTPPWYSAMAQGLAISLFLRLHDATGDDAWRSAADDVFQSFTKIESEIEPWVVKVDDSGYLWLEEYPFTPNDYTLNGHVFAIYGVYEYWLATGDSVARQIAQGAITTVKHYLEEFRNPGWISHYCLHHRVEAQRYHLIHMAQLGKLYSMTGDAYFAQMMDAFEDDFPSYKISGEVEVPAGTHEALELDKLGRETGETTIDVAKSATVDITMRKKVEGRDGLWLHIASGSLAGKWLREEYPGFYVPGPIAGTRHTYNPARSGTLRKGSYDAFAAAGGKVQGDVQALALGDDAPVQVHARMVIETRTFMLVSIEDQGDWWVPRDDGFSFTEA